MNTGHIEGGHRYPAILLIAASALVCSCMCASSQAPKPQRQTEHNDETVLTVMTLNIAHGRKDGRNQMLQTTASIRANLKEAGKFLRRVKPHVVALQEADGPSSWSGNFNHVKSLAEQAGYPHHFRGEHVRNNLLKLSYGTAVLSTLPLSEQESEAFEPSPPSPPKGYVRCTVNWPAGSHTTIDIVSVHLDFLRSGARNAQAREIIKAIEPRRRPLILIGDFNTEWNSDGSPLPLLAEKLDLDAYKPDAKDLATFPKFDSRLDWILISPEMEFVTYKVLPAVVSDHRAVLARIKLNDDHNPKD